MIAENDNVYNNFGILIYPQNNGNVIIGTQDQSTGPMSTQKSQEDKQCFDTNGELVTHTSESLQQVRHMQFMLKTDGTENIEAPGNLKTLENNKNNAKQFNIKDIEHYNNDKT